MYKFEYNGHTFVNDDEQVVVDYAVNWSDANWDAFVEFTNYLVTKENYEQYIESFLEETITESSDA